MCSAHLAAWTMRSRHTPTADAAALTSSCAAESAAPPCSSNTTVLHQICWSRISTTQLVAETTRHIHTKLSQSRQIGKAGAHSRPRTRQSPPSARACPAAASCRSRCGGGTARCASPLPPRLLLRHAHPAAQIQKMRLQAHSPDTKSLEGAAVFPGPSRVQCLELTN